jgi:SAM-dependent methyltransferase
MDTEEIRAKVESFPHWHYQFDLNGVRTPIFAAGHVNRHEQRKNYFFKPLVDLCGGSLAGKRVLDLACNAGFWSLSAIEAGADFVHGVDGRQLHVDQANLVFAVKGVEPERFRFETADVFTLDLSAEPSFDIVLCLGLLYHVSKPFELMERLASWNADLLVIDTAIDPVPGAYFRFRNQHEGDPRSAIDLNVALVPSRRAVVRLARVFGYRAVKILRPRFTDWEGSESYRNGRRRAYICSKRAGALRGLDAERIQPKKRPAQRASLPRRAARSLRRRLGLGRRTPTE